MKKYASVFVVTYLIWILLSGIDMMELIVGAIASAVISYVLANMTDLGFELFNPIGIVKFVFVYIPVFLLELVKANLDVARRVLSPKIPLNPGFVKIPTAIKSPYGRLILANSITLTPGTLSLDVDDDNVMIHWIDVKGETGEERQKSVSQSFEKVLGGIFK